MLRFQIRIESETSMFPRKKWTYQCVLKLWHFRSVLSDVILFRASHGLFQLQWSHHLVFLMLDYLDAFSNTTKLYKLKNNKYIQSKWACLCACRIHIFICFMLLYRGGWTKNNSFGFPNFLSVHFFRLFSTFYSSFNRICLFSPNFQSLPLPPPTLPWLVLCFRLHSKFSNSKEDQIVKIISKGLWEFSEHSVVHLFVLFILWTFTSKVYRV